jgi:hypothetical protein
VECSDVARRPASLEEAVSVNHRLRTLLCCLVLEIGALSGIPMRPEQIRDLMQSLNTPKIAHTDPERRDEDDVRVIQ